MALTGVLWSNVCYASTADALQAILATPQSIGATYVQGVVSASYDAVNNQFNIGWQYIDMNSFNGTFLTYPPVYPCDPAISLNGMTVFDPVLGAAFWSFAMSFVLGVWILSKNAGAIMSAIKRL